MMQTPCCWPCSPVGSCRTCTAFSVATGAIPPNQTGVTMWIVRVAYVPGTRHVSVWMARHVNGANVGYALDMMTEQSREWRKRLSEWGDRVAPGKRVVLCKAYEHYGEYPEVRYATPSVRRVMARATGRTYKSA